VFRANVGRGWCTGDAGLIPAAQSLTLQVKHRNKKNGFKLHVSKQVLMFVAGSFASK